MISVAVNEIPEKGEEDKTLSSCVLFDIVEGKLEKFFEAIELRGVLTGIKSMLGNLILCEGNKMVIYCYDKDNMTKIMSQPLKNVAVSFKMKYNAILLADLQAGFQIYKFAESEFVSAGEEVRNICCTASEFITDIKENVPVIKGYLVGDRDRFVRVYKQNKETKKGYGSNINIDDLGAVRLSGTVTNLSGIGGNVAFYTTEGEIGLIQTIKETQFQLLEAVTNYLCNNMPFRGGVNPKLGNLVGWQGGQYKGAFVMKSIIEHFANLPVQVQSAIGKQITFPREFIIQTVTEVFSER